MRGGVFFTVAAVGAVIASCRPFTEPPASTGVVEGQIVSGLPSDAYVFLYPPKQGPPGQPAVPLFAGAVSAQRFATGDSRFVIPGVTPGAYRLTGFLDHDANFRADVDVLAQAGEGDHPLSAVELQVDAGETSVQDLTALPALRHDPPAFRIASATGLTGGEVTLPDQPLQLLSFTLQPTDAGVLPGAHASLFVSLVDVNGDGQPDDLNGDGLPDLWPQAFLRFVAKHGQTVPRDDAGVAGEVVIPLLANPVPFITALGDNPSGELGTSSLQLFVVPQAQAVFAGDRAPDGGVATSPLPAIPVGSYELWLLDKTGQSWRVPNDLGTQGSELFGGDFSAQAVRVTVVHGS